MGRFWRKLWLTALEVKAASRRGKNTDSTMASLAVVQSVGPHRRDGAYLAHCWLVGLESWRL